MGVHLELENYDLLFQRGRKQKPIIINDIEENTEEDKKNLNKLIYTTFEPSDLLSNIPSCSCMTITGAFNEGIICPKCNTPVINSLEQELEPIVWYRAPKGIRALINPIVFTMLSERFKTQGFDVIRWLCDTKFTPPVQEPRVLPKILDLGIERGLNNFHDNFDLIMEALLSMKEYRVKKGVDGVPDLIKKYRNCIFSQYAPLPNRSILVIDKTNVGVYTDPIVPRIVDAVRTMVGIDSPLNIDTVRTKESKVARTIQQLASVYNDSGGVARNYMGKKEGLHRKHGFGCRAHWSGRAVISSITGNHRNDEIRIPWGIGVELFQVHIMNYLFRLGLTTNEAKSFLYAHSARTHPLLIDIFKTLISSSPYNGRGCHVVFTRNPTLGRGSCQGMYITEVKTDVHDPTIGLPILNVKSFNADFDGDEMSLVLSLDKYTQNKLEPLSPHKNTFHLDTPKKISNNNAHSKPSVSTMANFVHSPEPYDAIKEERMKELFE